MVVDSRPPVVKVELLEGSFEWYTVVARGVSTGFPFASWQPNTNALA
jgi:hypothetical protein